MIPTPRNSGTRIGLAVALSALIHGMVLWLPHVKLPSHEEPLPPLMAKLEPLPNLAGLRVHKRKPKPPALPPSGKPETPLPDTVPAADALGASAVAPTEALGASAVPATEPAAASAVSAAEAAFASAPAATDSAESTPATQPPSTAVAPPLLPRHARLRFAVRRGVDGFEVGEVQHRLDIADGHYTVQSSTQTTGLARWFKTYNLNQTSNGTVSAQGLRPEIFAEGKNDSGSLQTLTATFDWDAHMLHFSHGGVSALPEGAQDSLSILYQLSQLPLNAEALPVTISNGRKLEGYTLEIASGKTISTALGDLHTVHLRKLHQASESGLEIWLAMEYRLLPVKIRYFEPGGAAAATIIITEIRVADQ